MIILERERDPSAAFFLPKNYDEELLVFRNFSIRLLVGRMQQAAAAASDTVMYVTCTASQDHFTHPIPSLLFSVTWISIWCFSLSTMLGQPFASFCWLFPLFYSLFSCSDGSAAVDFTI